MKHDLERKMASDKNEDDKKFDEILNKIEAEHNQEINDIDEWGEILRNRNDNTPKND